MRACVCWVGCGVRVLCCTVMRRALLLQAAAPLLALLLSCPAFFNTPGTAMYRSHVLQYGTGGAQYEILADSGDEGGRPGPSGRGGPPPPRPPPGMGSGANTAPLPPRCVWLGLAWLLLRLMLRAAGDAEGC